MKSVSFTRAFVIAVCSAVVFIAQLSPVDAQPWRGGQGKNSFSAIYAFGDSLSDTGNFFALTGFPPEPYFEGRVSNGIIWVEYLGASLQIPADSVISYAFAGATTGSENYYDVPGVVEFPGLQDEITIFESNLAGGPADERALYIVWAGANDFFVFGPTPETIVNGVTNTATAVQRLHQAGARQIMVVNLPDLGLTPFGRSVDPTGLSFVSAVYNDSLDTALDGLAAAGIETIRVDSSRVLQGMVSNPLRYRFSNVTDAYLETGGNVGEFLFWDSVHPTTRGHSVIAQEAALVLRRRSGSSR